MQYTPPWKRIFRTSTSTSYCSIIIIKKEIAIIGDSIIKHVNGPEVSRVKLVKTRSKPSATTEDLIDYIKLTACNKATFINTRRSGIPNKLNTL